MAYEPREGEPATHDGNEHDVADERRRLQKVQAVLIAVQFTANHEPEFDVSDALAVIVALIYETVAAAFSPREAMTPLASDLRQSLLSFADAACPPWVRVMGHA